MRAYFATNFTAQPKLISENNDIIPLDNNDIINDLNNKIIMYGIKEIIVTNSMNYQFIDEEINKRLSYNHQPCVKIVMAGENNI